MMSAFTRFFNYPTSCSAKAYMLSAALFRSTPCISNVYLFRSVVNIGKKTPLEHNPHKSPKNIFQKTILEMTLMGPMLLPNLIGKQVKLENQL